MAGGHVKYRHLNRTSSHRQALLRNLVTSLITHESIKTTWHKAKEAQRLAEKLITLGKKNTTASRTQAAKILYDPPKHLPTLFTTLRERYLTRPGGYTRVLRIEPINNNHDQAASAILELVDGPRDMRFAMTAKTLSREMNNEEGIRDITARNIAKVTKFRPDGEEALLSMVRRIDSQKALEMEAAGNESDPTKSGSGSSLPRWDAEKEGWETAAQVRADMKKMKEEALDMEDRNRTRR